jgi:hypothetical protein
VPKHTFKAGSISKDGSLNWLYEVVSLAPGVGAMRFGGGCFPTPLAVAGVWGDQPLSGVARGGLWVTRWCHGRCCSKP